MQTEETVPIASGVSWLEYHKNMMIWKKIRAYLCRKSRYHPHFRYWRDLIKRGNNARFLKAHIAKLWIERLQSVGKQLTVRNTRDLSSLAVKKNGHMYHW